MNWTYSIKNKLAASAALCILCLLVFFSNYIDRDHTQSVKNAISTLYEDRLVAEEYILKMTIGVYQVKEAIHISIDDSSKVNNIGSLLLNITEEYSNYQETKFTDIEKIKAEELLNILRELESIKHNNNQLKLSLANRALSVLNDLSSIQLQESKKIIKNAEALYISGDNSSQLVFSIIIIIFIVLQALVFASKTLGPKTKTKYPHLN